MLKMGLSLVTGMVRERLGQASALDEFLLHNAGKLKAGPFDAGQSSIAAHSVPGWHEWGLPSRSDGMQFKSGELMGWKTHPDFSYRSYRVVRPELAGFGSGVRFPRWRCDIQDVEGLQTMGAELSGFASLDALGEHSMDTLVHDASTAGLARLLARPEIQLLRRQRSGAHFVCPLWDGRVFLVNAGAPRHFAAARHLAARLGQRISLGAELRAYSIEPSAVSILRRDFELFAVSARDTFTNIRFHEAVRESRTPYLSKRMPRPHADVEVIFLPRRDHRAMRLAAAMRAAGFTDVGKHLSTLVLRQHMYTVRGGGRQEIRAA